METGFTLVVMSLYIGNMAFWMRQNFDKDWDIGLCLFMAFGMPFMVWGVYLLASA